MIEKRGGLLCPPPIRLALGGVSAGSRIFSSISYSSHSSHRGLPIRTMEVEKRREKREGG